MDRIKAYLRFLREAAKMATADLEDINSLIANFNQSGELRQELMLMLEGTMKLGNLRVKNVMVPRSQMIVIEKSHTFQEVVHIAIDSGHSRFPVTGDDVDDIHGIMLAKDLLNGFQLENKKHLNLEDYTRPPFTVPESKGLQGMLRDFRENRYHMAIVVDEYSGVSGLVTIEDVLEQIVGQISDEHDLEASGQGSITNLGKGVYVISGNTPIETFNQYFDADLPLEHAETIAGLVIQKRKSMPQRGESLTVGKWKFTVKDRDTRKINTLFAKTAS